MGFQLLQPKHEENLWVSSFCSQSMRKTYGFPAFAAKAGGKPMGFELLQPKHEENLWVSSFCSQSMRKTYGFPAFAAKA